MKDLYERIEEAASMIKMRFDSKCDLAIITGSGLDVLLQPFEILARISFSEIPHMPVSTFHKGDFLLCRYNQKTFIALNGRLHYYEGYSAQEVTFPVRVLTALGIRYLILTNASGGLNSDYNGGDVVMIKDHINLFPEHPLRGYNDDRLGDRFPDMSDAYAEDLRKLTFKIALSHALDLKEGVYVGFQGPSLETPAEYRFLHIIGGDMVGMSTVPEAIVANHAGLRLIGFSIVTNVCYPPERIRPTTVEDVIHAANKAAPKLSLIINDLIDQLID